MKQIIPYIIIAILLFFLIKTCNEPDPKPEVITKITTVHDTIFETKISEPKKVYYTKKVKEIDTIIKTDTIYTINNFVTPAFEYKTELKSNNATADLKITTTGELLDVKGVITYPEKETIIKTPINKSYFYLSGLSNTQLNQFGVGVDYTIKNKSIIGVGVIHDTQQNNQSILFKVGVRF